ncbi:MAG: sugar transferase [Solirubrobacterales bacterium]|nr:sugar transferase [Solirubrobacterales bacterium]
MGARGRDASLRWLLATGDAVAVFGALVLAMMLPTAGGGDLNGLLWGLVAIPLTIVLFKVYGLYDRDMKRIAYSTVDDLPPLLNAVVIGTLLLWLYARVTPMVRLDLAEVLTFGTTAVGLSAAARFVIRYGSTRLIGPERALLIGGGERARTLAAKLSAHPEYGVEIVGSLSTDSDPGQPAAATVLGELGGLAGVAASVGAARIVLAADDIDESALEPVLRECRARSLKVSVLPTLSHMLGVAVEIDDVEGVAVLGVNPPWLPRSSRLLKRTMDVLIASVMLIVGAPFFVLFAIAIKRDSPGPVLFRQERVGKGDCRFQMLKLRTMVSDAEQRRAELVACSNDPHWLKLEHDPRVTRFGARLRRLSLDELPQLWNVLRGEMSMVGPRPLIPVEDERVIGWARGRLDLTPGITGYWQVLGRTRIPFEEMVKLDYMYVMNWSLWEDLRLMLRTLPAVLGGRGVN